MAITIINTISLPNPISGPNSLCSDGNYFYVTDASNNKVFKLTLDDNIISTVNAYNTYGTGFLPIDKYLYRVAEAHNNFFAIQMTLNHDVIKVYNLPALSFSAPTLCFDGARFYITFPAGNSVLVFDTSFRLIDWLNISESFSYGDVLTYDGKFFYLSNNTYQLLTKFDNFFNAIAIYDFSTAFIGINGLVWNGVNFYSVEYYTGNLYKFSCF